MAKAGKSNQDEDIEGLVTEPEDEPVPAGGPNEAGKEDPGPAPMGPEEDPGPALPKRPEGKETPQDTVVASDRRMSLRDFRKGMRDCEARGLSLRDAYQQVLDPGDVYDGLSMRPRGFHDTMRDALKKGFPARDALHKGVDAHLARAKR
jgi:hypothetical protein